MKSLFQGRLRSDVTCLSCKVLKIRQSRPDKTISRGQIKQSRPDKTVEVRY